MRLRLVAATSRTSTLCVRPLPKRSNSCSCNTRSNFGCSTEGISPTSSKNSVPLSAISKRPIFCAIQLYECASIALTCSVNGMCDELFSGTGFPLDEDSRVCGSNLLHLVEDRFEGSAISYDPLECAFGLIRSRARDWCVVFHTRPLRLRLLLRLL